MSLDTKQKASAVGEFFQGLRTDRVSGKPWFSETIISRQWVWFGVGLHFQKRSKHGWMGRFGGGWQWKVGFQASSNTVILNLLVASLRISWYKPKEDKQQ